MAKEFLGAYAEPDLVERIVRECGLDYGRSKSQMVVVLLTEALDAREAKRPKVKGQVKNG